MIAEGFPANTRNVMSELSTATVDTDADTDTVVAESGEAKENQEKPRVPVPDFIDLNEFQKRSLNELHAIAQEIGLRVAGVRSKHQLVFEILCYYSNRGTRIEAEGLLEYNGEAHGFLRWPDLSFMPNIDDVYLAPFLVRKHEIKSGNLVRARVRAPKDREKFLSVEEIVSIEGIPAEEWKSPVPFDNLTALFPQERLILEIPDSPSPSPGSSISSRRSEKASAVSSSRLPGAARPSCSKTSPFPSRKIIPRSS